MQQDRTHRRYTTWLCSLRRGTLCLGICVSCLLIAALAACSSDSTIDDEHRVDLRQPMRFGASSTAIASSETEVTRAALQTTHNDFKVGTWKAFGLATQQNVMDGYMVKYQAETITDGTYSYNWYYQKDGSSEDVIKDQLLRYWDLGAFPYEFRAVAPYSTDATITPDGLTINAAFQSQTMSNDVLTPANSATVPEPCVVANVSRTKDETNYIDTDKLRNNTEINTTGKADATREVHVPFHHLLSKVGFRIFIDNPMPTSMEHQSDYGVWIDNITVTIKKDGLITASSSYTATNDQGLLRGTFGGNTTTSDEHTILFHNAYYNAEIQNLHYHLNKANAFDMTPDCIQQIPQQGVKVHVRMTIHTNHVESDQQVFNYDSWLSLDKTNTYGDLFTWEPDTKYIYYLHIPNLHGHEIYLHTCEILPWDEVQTTDIPVEM